MDSAASFTKLPISLRLRIFEHLDWDGTLQARLVCEDWYQLINHLKPPDFLITDQPNPPNYYIENGAGLVLPCLIKSNCEKLGRLKVQNLKTPLPITSSTRMLIPRAEELVLADGNSKQNVQKLLRYYASSLRTLCLESYCLALIKPREMKRIIFWNKMTKLDITFDLKPRIDKSFDLVKREERIQLEGTIKQHLINLGAFLASVRLQNLRCLELHLSTAVGYPPKTSHLMSLAKLSAGFEEFMKIHGPGLAEMGATLPCFDIMNSLKHTSSGRLRKLNLTYAMDYSGRYNDDYGFLTDPRLALSCFTNLVELHLEPYSFRMSHSNQLPEEEENIHHEVASQFLTNNIQTLRTFSYTGQNGIRFRNFGWLIPGLKLQRVRLFVTEFHADLFTLGHGNKLEQVKKFSLDLNVRPESEWSPSVFRWVAHTMPALKDITITSWRFLGLPAGLLALRTLIDKSASLHRLHLVGWYQNENEKPVTDEVEEWMTSTNGKVTGKWATLTKGADFDEEYEITIHRP